jgi:hypothetical protein
MNWKSLSLGQHISAAGCLPKWQYTHPLLFAGLYLMVLRICMVTLNIKIHQSDPSVGGSIKIARQLKQVFEPYCMMFKEKRKQLPLQCFCEEKKNT